MTVTATAMTASVGVSTGVSTGAAARAVMPPVGDRVPRRSGRRETFPRRYDHGRSRPPALFDRSEVPGAVRGDGRGTTVGDDRVGAVARAGIGNDGVSGVDGRVDRSAGGGGGTNSGTNTNSGGGSARANGSDVRPSGGRRYPARPMPPVAPVAPAARGLLADASLGLGRACSAGDPADRYAIAHLAALRGAAAVLAARARSTRGRQGSVWTLMTRVAPEFAEWAAFFAAGSAKRQAVQAGLPAGVTAREADDLVRQVALFLSLVGESIEPATGR